MNKADQPLCIQRCVSKVYSTGLKYELDALANKDFQRF